MSEYSVINCKIHSENHSGEKIIIIIMINKLVLRKIVVSKLYVETKPLVDFLRKKILRSRGRK